MEKMIGSTLRSVMGRSRGGGRCHATQMCVKWSNAYTHPYTHLNPSPSFNSNNTTYIHTYTQQTKDPPAFAAYPHPPPALQDLADFLTREGSFPPPSSSAVSSSSSAVEIGREDDDEEEEDWEGDVDGMGSQQQQRQRPLTIATIEQMGALAIDEEAIRWVDWGVCKSFGHACMRMYARMNRVSMHVCMHTFTSAHLTPSSLSLS